MEWKHNLNMETPADMITRAHCLDLSRLEKVRSSGGKIIARCPACAEGGADRKGNHLCIFPSDKFGCAAVSGDAEHQRRIVALVGILGECERDPERERLWREQRASEELRARQRQCLLFAIRQKRQRIIARHLWAPEDVWEDSPQRIDCALVESDPRHFLSSLLPAEANVWTGSVTQSGKRHADRWRSVAAWHEASLDEIGPMTTPTLWKPETVSRIAENAHAAPYVVCDFDGFDGQKPETPAEIEQHRRDSLALIRWLREGLRWQLAAILWTGSKSLHAWFHTPPDDVLLSLRDTAPALGIDVGLIGRAEHPCRLPGQFHEKTGGMSRVLWLQPL
jgi:hypothetical protein